MTDKKGKKYWSENWDASTYLKQMTLDGAYNMRIIAQFALAKEYTFDNYDQMQHFIMRNRRTADRLLPYTIKQIKATLDYLKDEADYKWTLETVEKYIFEDLDKLSNKEPIITLKSGEKIYDIERIKQLEARKTIRWDIHKQCWNE